MKHSFFNSFLILLGRLAIGLLFFLSGFGKFFTWPDTIGYIQSKGMPFASFWLITAAVFEIVGGLSLILGFKMRVGAWILIIFLIPTTVIFHNFWELPLSEQPMQKIMFMKNIAILGALCYFAAIAQTGYFSIDYWINRKRHIGKSDNLN